MLALHDNLCPVMLFFFSSRRRHTRLQGDWSSDVCSSDLATAYVLRYGEFDFDIIPNLIRKLQRARLLTLEPKSRLRQALARNRGQRVAKAEIGRASWRERV